MINIVLTMKNDDNMFGYTFAASSVEEFKRKTTEYVKKLNVAGIRGYAVHTINLDEKETIQQHDAYFEDAVFLNSIEEFIERANEEKTLTKIDVASYLNTKYNLTSFQLQKIIYYIYSDYLCSENAKLFRANFEAWDYGPVDRDIYRIKTYSERTDLNRSNIYNKIDSTSLDVLRFLDEECLAYKDKLNDVNNNPTHRKNTPWTNTFKNGTGKNNLITDEVIMKYHELEKI
ncbi:Panacea domain-containing protein [Weissella viridescens]